MRILFSLFILLSTFYVNGQITAEKKMHDFGELYPNAQTYVDIEFTNNTDKKHYLLTVEKPRDVYYIFSSKVLMPDSSITIRLKINNGRKGKFNHEIDIYFSDSQDPTTIRLKGNVKEVSSNPLTECPDFSKPQKDNRLEFAITVKVIDSLTGDPLKRSKVYFVQNNTLVGEFFTNKDGIVHQKMPMGYYFITANKDPYIPNYKEGYLNFQRNYVEIPMQKTPNNENPPDIALNEEPEVIVEQPDIIDEEPEIIIDLTEEPEIVEEIVMDSVPAIEIVEEPPYIDETPLAELPDTLFDYIHFKENNITFILDVSSSMNSSGKLDLLKLSMLELVEDLRSEDLITVLKYSSTVGIVVDGLSGNDKEEINEKVAELRTSAATAGGDAIEEAYKMNKKIYSAEKNNIVIMITDGAFNKGSKTYLETIRKNYQRKGIIFSVVGIKTSKYITDHMQNIVEKGGGSFIEIRTAEDAKTKILEEIRRTSFKTSQ